MQKLFVDISDLLIYAAGNRRITGIQRVEISFLQFMIENRLKYSLINPFGINISLVDSIIREKIYSPDDLLHALGQECEHLAPRKIAHKIRRIYQQISWTFFGGSGEPLLKSGDTLFVPGAYWLDSDIMRFYRAAVAKGVKLIVFLHDVLPVTHPHLMIENSDRFFGAILKLPVHVITGSRATEADLPGALKCIQGAKTPLSVKVVALAHEFPSAERNQRAKGISDRLKRRIRDRPFVLFVSTVEVRKNHLRLLEVWDRLAKELGTTLPLLVVAGKRGWEAERAIGLLDAANERDARNVSGEPVAFIEAPSDAELQWLYAACDFTVYPSLAEGWGLPVGESLWFGKACAASQTTSIPEVGSDLCVYFDPACPDEMANAIKSLLDPALRASYECKIRSAPLRTWNDTGGDLAMAVIAHLPAQQAGHMVF